MRERESFSEEIDLLAEEKSRGLEPGTAETQFAEGSEEAALEEAVARSMLRRTRRVLQFYIEKREFHEVEAARSEYLRLKAVRREMRAYGKALCSPLFASLAKEFGLAFVLCCPRVKVWL